MTVEGKGHAYWRSGGQERRLECGTTTNLAELRGTTHARPDIVSRNAVRATSDSVFNVVMRGGDEGARALQRLIDAAALGAPGKIDPAPLVNRLLEIRAAARSEGLYGVSDQIRDALTSCDIEISDGPSGSSWHLRNAD